MGESSACLLRSYSQPSPQTQQGNPYSCLRSSISFGRYMSESLDWERWSTFTENRYMEDVKKYSRPGSVAQMKAHFEAHYKKKAAERAVALLEKHNGICISNIDQEPVRKDNHVTRGDIREENVTRYKVSDSVEVSRCSPPCGEGKGTEGARFFEIEEDQLVDQVDVLKSLEADEDAQASGYNLSTDRRKQDCTLFPNVENPVMSDRVDVCGQFKSIEDNGNGVYVDNGKTQIKEIGELRDPASLEKRKAEFSHLKSRGHIGVPKPPAPPNPSIPIQKRQYRKANLGSRENTPKVENKKAKTRSLHMSINLSPKETKKQLSPILQSLFHSRLVKTLAGKVDQATQGMALRDIVDIPAHPPVSLQQRKLSSSKSPGRRIRNVQPPTVSCPFSFKSEERAAKRKEFFERLAQNDKAKETEKITLQENPKVKARNDFRYMHTATSKVGPGSHSFHPRTPNDASNVIPALPCSRFVRGEILKDNDARPCKEARGKNKQSLTFTVKSKKSTTENASPNIQL